MKQETDSDLGVREVGSHLEGIKDGAGCVETWEHLSEDDDGEDPVLPGFTYKREPITDSMDDTVGGNIAHVGMTFTLTTIGRFKPTHPVTWTIQGIVLTVTTLTWLFTMGGVLLILGMLLIPIEESWRSMRDR